MVSGLRFLYLENQLIIQQSEISKLILIFFSLTFPMILVLLQRKGSVTSTKVRPSLLYFLLLWKQEEPETFGKSLSFYDKSCVISRAGFMPSPTWKHRQRWWELRLWLSFRISPCPLPVALALPKGLGAGFGTAHHCALITCQLPISEWWLLRASVSPPVTQRSLCLFLVDLEAGMFFFVWKHKDSEGAGSKVIATAFFLGLDVTRYSFIFKICIVWVAIPLFLPCYPTLVLPIWQQPSGRCAQHFGLKWCHGMLDAEGWCCMV